MKKALLFKKLKKNAVKNKYYTIVTALFLLTILLVLIISVLKVLVSKPSHVYAKVVVSHGVWWAQMKKPEIWLKNAIQKGEREYDLSGKPIAEILEVKYYPSYQPAEENANSYDIYLTLKLTTKYNKKANQHVFKRSVIAVGSPIELSVPSSKISGTIIELSEEKPTNNYVEKEVTLSKKLAFPWEFDAIKVGDKQFDGEEVVFEVVDKKALRTSLIDVDPYGNINLSMRDPRRYITVIGKMKLVEKEGQFVFGERQIIKPGTLIYLATSGFSFDGWIVQEINPSNQE